MTVARAVVAARITEEAIEAKRLESGLLAYCPVCRRQVSPRLLSPLMAARTVAAHLISAHDAIYARLLELFLKDALAAVPDPFYPAGTEW